MKKSMIVLLGCTMATGVFAGAGFQASLTPDIAIHDRDTEITGVSIGVWNENPAPKFQWQLGFVNGATGDSIGVQWFVLLPTFYNYAERHTGLQWGVVNYISEEITGAQLGIVNIAKAVDGGFQMGLVNYTGSAHNLFQLGLVNIIEDNEWFKDFPGDLAKGMVFVNWSFGGAK